MNWRRGLFRLWIVGTVLFVLAVAFVSYGEIKRQFEPREETSVPVQCGLARGKAGTDYAVKKTAKPGPWDAYAERNPDAPCWYAISKFRTFYPEYKDLTDTELIVKLNVALNLITFAIYRTRRPGRQWRFGQASHSAFRWLSERPWC